MSSIGFREWEIWTNQSWFQEIQELSGYYSLTVENLLMAQQTVEYLNRDVPTLIQGGHLNVQNHSYGYFLPSIWRQDGLRLQKRAKFHTATAPSEVIQHLLNELDALSTCVDFGLVCNQIEFVIPPGGARAGKVFIASRMPLVRALAFEVEERGAANQKISKDFDFLLLSRDSALKVGIKHYLNGLTLLGLEDGIPGLIDAAFMQFYQACEILCGNNSKLDAAQRHIARQGFQQSKELQIIAHHVWQVRHNYFGHGNVNNALYAATNLSDAYRIAKQVLVARWLARQLIDGACPSGVVLCREMRLYYRGESEQYSGTIAELEGAFRVNYRHRVVKIYDMSGSTQVDRVTLKK